MKPKVKVDRSTTPARFRIHWPDGRVGLPFDTLPGAFKTAHNIAALDHINDQFLARIDYTEPRRREPWW